LPTAFPQLGGHAVEAKMSTALALVNNLNGQQTGGRWRHLRQLVDARDDLLLQGRKGRWRLRWVLLATLLAAVGIALLQMIAVGIHWAFNGQLPDDLILDPKSPSSFLEMLVSFLPLIVVPCLLMRYLHRAPWRQLIATSGRFEWDLYVRAAAVPFIAMLVLVTIDYAVDPAAYQLVHHDFSLAPWLVLGLAVIFVQTLAEEVLFRGYLMRTWGAVIPYRVLTTSIVMGVFVSMHLTNADMKSDIWFNLICFVLTQIVWCYVWFRTRSIASTAGLHWANNVGCFFMVATVPGQSTAMAIASNTDAVLLAGGSHLLDPYAWSLQILGLALTVLLLVWRRSPFYLPVRGPDVDQVSQARNEPLVSHGGSRTSVPTLGADARSLAS
jgi:membrane protease YdiL (CAAX protease family)